MNKFFFFLFSVAVFSFNHLFAQEKISNDRQVLACFPDMPEFPGGQEALVKFIQQNLVYPAAAKDQNISGRVIVNFEVKPGGSIGEVKIIKGIGGGCDEEAVRVVKAMPNWVKSRKTTFSYNLPITFSLSDDTKDKQNAVAEFPGGEDAMKKFVAANLMYPKKAKKKKTEGVSSVQFDIDADGNISNPKLINSLGNGCDEEVMRIYNLLPKKWGPAYTAGKAVSSTFVLPVIFTLKK